MRHVFTRRIVLGVTAAAATVLLGCLPAVVVRAGTHGGRFQAGEDVPARPVALVLGAGIAPDGTPTPMLQLRIDAAADLYHAGKVRALLLSGDHSTTDHDEVEAMARAAQARGVPASAMVADHAGFDTFSSCYRARHVFGVRRMVVISQSWHLPRAVWLCRQEGIDAVGAAPPDSFPAEDLFGTVREVPAALKATFDVLRGRLPTFPGPVEHSLDAVNALP